MAPGPRTQMQPSSRPSEGLYSSRMPGSFSQELGKNLAARERKTSLPVHFCDIDIHSFSSTAYPWGADGESVSQQSTMRTVKSFFHQFKRKKLHCTTLLYLKAIAHHCVRQDWHKENVSNDKVPGIKSRKPTKQKDYSKVMAASWDSEELFQVTWHVFMY